MASARVAATVSRPPVPADPGRAASDDRPRSPERRVQCTATDTDVKFGLDAAAGAAYGRVHHDRRGQRMGDGHGADRVGTAVPGGPDLAVATGGCSSSRSRAGTLAAVSPDGTVERVATTGGGPNGAALGPDGKVYVCNNGGFEWHERRRASSSPAPQPADYIGGRIQRVDIDTGEVEDLYTEVDGHPLRGPERHRVRRRRRLLLHRPRQVAGPGGRQGRRVLRHERTARRSPSSPTGSTTPTASPSPPTAATCTSPRRSPAGCGRGTIAVAGRARRRRPRPVGHGTLLYSFDGYQLLDSMAVDGAGNICVATLITGAVSVVSPDRRAARPVHGARARSVRHQRLLRRRRLPHGVHHVVGARAAVRDDWPGAGHRLHFER